MESWNPDDTFIFYLFVRVLSLHKIHPTTQLPLPTTLVMLSNFPICSKIIPRSFTSFFPSLLFPSLPWRYFIIMEWSSTFLKVQTFKLILITCCYLLPRYLFGVLPFVEPRVCELYLATSISFYRLQRSLD